MRPERVPQTCKGGSKRGFVSKWIAGRIGVWLGSPVLGHWWFQVQDLQRC